MLTNPYLPGQVSLVLAGRDRVKQLINDRLARTATFGEFGGPLLAFHAPRGLGKTSLLRDAQRDTERIGFVTAWASAVALLTRALEDD